LRLDHLPGLRPPYPPIVLELEGQEVVFVRLKRAGRGKPLLEAHEVRDLPELRVPASIFEPLPAPAEGVSQQIRQLFEVTGTRPGRVSVVLPDNLAKITLLDLPERPASRRQLEELVRAKMRRAVPFRLEEARLTYQQLPGEGRHVSVLVVVVRRALVERIERAFSVFGARAGLVDICTSNLINLCRGRLDELSQSSGDAALLNCARHYFSLVIVRGGRLIFFRCKSFAVTSEKAPARNGLLRREIANSFSYYREKLDGKGIHTVLVRSVDLSREEIAEKLTGLEIEQIDSVDPLGAVELPAGVHIDGPAAQRLAPVLGAAALRTG
jgi:hypothetical protein